MSQKNGLIIGFDIGTRSIVGVAAVNDFNEKDHFRVEAAHVEFHTSRSMIDGQIQDVNEVAKTIYKVKKALEAKIGQPITEAYVAAAGRVLQTVTVEVEKEIEEEDGLISAEMITSLELMALGKAKKELQTDSEEKFYGIGHSVMKYFLNGYEIVSLLDQRGRKMGLSILATFLPVEVVESLYQVMEKADMKVAYLTLEPIAASQIAIPQSFRLLNIALVDIGAGTSDIALTSGGTVTAYGMIPVAGDEITETIVQQYLVDFETAERMKLDSTRLEEAIEYTDIMELTQTVAVDTFLQGLRPTLESLADQIAKKIIQLNGDKAPNAVFIVGGGGQVKGFSELLAKKIGLPEARVSLRGKEALKEVEVADQTFKKTPEFITPIGICYKGLADSRQDFIQVYLNDKPVRLFNKKSLTVMDIMAAEGIDPRNFLLTKGSPLNFYFNGKAYSIEGEYGEVAEIYKNHDKAMLSDSIESGDYIYYKEAVKGKNAKLSIYQFITEKLDYSASEADQDFYYVTVNGKLIPTLYQLIQENDRIFCRPRREEDEWYAFAEEDVEPAAEPVKEEPAASTVRKGYARPIEAARVAAETAKSSEAEEKAAAQPNKRVKTKEPALRMDAEAAGDQKPGTGAKAETETVSTLELPVMVNGEPILLLGKPSYIFVDIFDYIEFDRSQVKGKLVVKKNGETANYFDNLQENDTLEVYWE